MYCICCKENKIKPLPHNDVKVSEEEYLWSVVKNKKITGEPGSTETTNNRMWNGGIVHIIEAGYGSGHDGDQYIIAICDDCITKESEDGTLLYFGDYLIGTSGTNKVYKTYDDEMIEKSKKTFRRRNNLDKLI